MMYTCDELLSSLFGVAVDVRHSKLIRLSAVNDNDEVEISLPLGIDLSLSPFHC